MALFIDADVLALADLRDCTAYEAACMLVHAFMIEENVA